MAGAVASTEGKLAHLAGTGLAAAVVRGCLHHCEPASSLHLQGCRTCSAQHSLSTPTPFTTLMHTTLLTHSAVPCNPTSLPGRFKVLQLQTRLGLSQNL